MSEGELKKRILESGKALQCGQPYIIGATKYKAGLVIIDSEELHGILSEAVKEYPQVSQKYLPVTSGQIDWETSCKLMEQKIIEFENFGKKWFGMAEKEKTE